MKKFLFLTIVTYLVLISFVGCEKTEKKIKIYPYLRVGFQLNKQSAEYKTALKFQEKVNTLSYGEIDIKIFPDGTLGDDRKMIEDVAAGKLDITYAETGRLGLYVPEAEIFGYPFAFDNFDHLKRTLESDYGKELHQKFIDKGLRVLATGYNGSRQTTSNKPIYSIKDMKGLKLRVPFSDLNLKYAEYSGAEPNSMAFSEVYPALANGVIDSQENPLTTIVSKKFYEVQKYCALTNHIINDNNIIISEKVYQSLSPSHQKAVTEAAIYAANYETELVKENEISLIEYLQSKGMIFTKPDRKSFKKAYKPMYDEYISKYGNAAVNAIIAAK